jgi:hypothetical protein
MTSIFCDIIPYNEVKVNRHFGGTYLLRRQCSSVSQERSREQEKLILLFDPEVGGDIFLRNVSWFSMDCTALYSRGQNSLGFYVLD